MFSILHGYKLKHRADLISSRSQSDWQWWEERLAPQIAGPVHSAPNHRYVAFLLMRPHSVPWRGCPLALGGWRHMGRLPESLSGSQSKGQWRPGTFSEHFWIWFRKHVVSKYLTEFLDIYFKCQATWPLQIISSPTCSSFALSVLKMKW